MIVKTLKFRPPHVYMQTYIPNCIVQWMQFAESANIRAHLEIYYKLVDTFTHTHTCFVHNSLLYADSFHDWRGCWYQDVREQEVICTENNRKERQQTKRNWNCKWINNKISASPQCLGSHKFSSSHCRYWMKRLHPLLGSWRRYANVTVYEQIGHNAQKCKNSLFLQHNNSGTTMCPEPILGIGIVEG